MIVYKDEQITLRHGDSLDELRELPAESVDCCVTSPPYFGLRDYGEPGQIGLEPSPDEYVEKLRELFHEVRRVLSTYGTLWLNLGDSYYSGRGNPGPNSDDEKQTARRGWQRTLDKPGQSWAKPKDLLGIPWRVAFALQADGWTLRNAIVWHKPNAMPESVTDRLASDYEHVFMLTKSRRYWFDLDAIREPHAESTAASLLRKRSGYEAPGQRPQMDLRSMPEAGANPGSVWNINTQPFSEAHFATMPVALAERCILAGSRPGSTVLDPFSGSGTTGAAANKHGRKYLGIDLNADYLELSLRTRLAQGSLGFGETG